MTTAPRQFPPIPPPGREAEFREAIGGRQAMEALEDHGRRRGALWPILTAQELQRGGVPTKRRDERLATLRAFYDEVDAALLVDNYWDFVEAFMKEGK